jgi:hypothetical protein
MRPVRSFREDHHCKWHGRGKLPSFFEPLASGRTAIISTRGLAARLMIDCTPEHGSWLNVAGIEQSILAREALSPRVPDRVSMTKLTAAWARRRNRVEGTADGRCTIQALGSKSIGSTLTLTTDSALGTV